MRERNDQIPLTYFGRPVTAAFSSGWVDARGDSAPKNLGNPEYMQGFEAQSAAKRPITAEFAIGVQHGRQHDKVVDADYRWTAQQREAYHRGFTKGRETRGKS